tara:strand:+ start:2427 stop:2921 length:495 start_codon:yes stop_codon:yes gene_type:complete
MESEIEKYLNNFENKLKTIEASSQMYSAIKAINSSNKTKCDQLVAEGVALHQRGMKKAALDKFDAALNLEIDVDALNNKGYILYESGDYSEAIRAFSAAILLLPQFTNVYMNRLKVWAALIRTYEFKGDYAGIEVAKKWLFWDADQMIKFGESPDAVSNYIESL